MHVDDREEVRVGVMSPHPNPLRSLLERSGYAIAVRRDGWVEILISRGAERWVGRGEDEGEALDDALRAMLPSALGRELLRGVLTEAPQAPSAEPDPPPEPAPASPSPPPAPGPAAPPTTADRTPSDPSPAAPESKPAPEPEGSAPSAPAEQADPTPEQEIVGGAAPAAIPPGPPVGEALEELDLLRRRILDARPELAMMSDEFQRLHILAWICRGRAIQERHPHDMAVERAAGDIARILGGFGKIWWPGSVRALQLRATPLDAGGELGLEGGGRLHDWLEAAERAEEVLAERLAQVGDGPVDDYGWADRTALDPAPNAPGDMLREVLNGLERRYGPLDRSPRREARDRLRRAEPGDVRDLVDWARKVRWLRGHTEDEETWGVVMGRLRWAAHHLPGTAPDALATALDPSFRPPRPWPRVLGQNPEKKQRRRRRKDLLRSLPTNGDGPAPDPEALAQWLGEAFELGAELPNPRISGLIYPVREQVLALDMEALPENSRRMRKRLADLKKRLQIMGSSEADAIRRDAHRELDAPEEPEPKEPEPVNVPDPMERMIRDVRRHTEGKKALFVSNRDDPALEARLEEMLGLELTWTVIDPRRVQSKADSIEQGSFDFVLSATGFQGHTVDSILCKAAKAADTRYIRVNRGRPHTCVRSLARELGLRHPSRV